MMRLYFSSKCFEHPNRSEKQSKSGCQCISYIFKSVLLFLLCGVVAIATFLYFELSADISNRKYYKIKQIRLLSSSHKTKFQNKTFPGDKFSNHQSKISFNDNLEKPLNETLFVEDNVEEHTESIFVKPVTHRRNVLFIIADDMGPEVGVYAKKDKTFFNGLQTPHLDTFAQNSLVMTKAYSQYALCAPSRNSFLTGRRPDTTKAYGLSQYWRKTGGNFTTIPQYFKEQGYHSIGVGKVFHSGPSSNDNDHIYSWSETPYVPLQTEAIALKMAHSWYSISNQSDTEVIMSDRKIADYAIKKLQERAPDARTGKQPFFMAVGFRRPHLPFVAPEEFFNLYPEVDLAKNPYVPTKLPLIAWQGFGELRAYKDIASIESIHGSFNTSVPDWKARELRRGYYACVSYVDSLFGEVLAELDRLGLSNDTIVLFAGDHGFQLGERAEWCKHSNFEESVQVPLMLRVPGETDGGRETDSFVELTDIFATLVEAAGIPSIPVCPDNSTDVLVCHEGHSLMGLVRGAKTWKRAVFFQYKRYYFNIMGYGIRTDDYKYVRWVDFRNGTPQWNNTDLVDPPPWKSTPARELYDLKLDPFMDNNVAGETDYKESLSKLDNMLQAGWRAALPES